MVQQNTPSQPTAGEVSLPSESLDSQVLAPNLTAFSSVFAALGLSRLIGLVREVIMADLFGARPVYDALIAVWRLVATFETLLVESSFSKLLVRSFAGKNSEDDLHRWLNSVLGIALIATTVICLIVTLSATLIINTLLPTAAENVRAIASTLLQWSIWTFVVIAVGGVFGALLLSRHQPLAPTLASALRSLCVCIAGSYFIYVGQANPEAIMLSWCLGVVLGVLLLVGWTIRKQRVKISLQWLTPQRGVGAFYGRGLSTAGASLPVHIQGWLTVIMAGLLGAGAISWQNYAMKIAQLPLALIGAGLGFVVVGRLSQFHVSKSWAQYQEVLVWGIRLTLLLTIPAAVGLYYTSTELISVILQHGSFTAWDVVKVSGTLKAQAFSVPLLSLNAVLVTALFASSFHTRAILITSLGAVFTAILAYIFGLQLQRGLGGLALAAFPAQLLVTFFLIRVIPKGFGVSKFVVLNKGFWRAFLRICLASLTMGMALIYLKSLPIASEVVVLMILIFGGILCYTSILYLLGMRIRHVLH